MPKLFGFKIQDSEDDRSKKSIVSPVPENQEDSSDFYVSSGFYGQYVDIEGVYKSEYDLIKRYREMALHPEVDGAIEDVINEAIVSDQNDSPVQIDLSNVPASDKLKKIIRDEFIYIKEILDFDKRCHEILRNWYVDGRIYYHKVIDLEKPQEGIKEVRYIDPTKIKLVRKIKRDGKHVLNPSFMVTDGKSGNVSMSTPEVEEFYEYDPNTRGGQRTSTFKSGVGGAARISKDSITYVHSGLVDRNKQVVLSYLHKAIKALNQLRMIEDAIVIYRLSRAPERRIFYIDVGNLPKGKAEQYLRDVMVKYRNKMVYDAATGELRDDRKHMSMLEDFWLPRREGGKGTEITTLPAGQNLGELEDVKYFRQKLLQSLNVPISRLEPQQGGMIGVGRTSEVTRDEVKFAKFIQRLRNKFSQIFDQALRVQLVLKGICTQEEWEDFKEAIYYDFLKDNNFTEMRDAELLRERVGLLQTVDPYIGRYYSAKWVRKNILQMNDEDIQQMEKEIKEEEDNGTGGPTMQDGEQVSPEQYPPEDNTVEKGAEDSKTPQLDADVEKYSSINRN